MGRPKYKHVWIITGNAFQYGWLGSTKRLMSVAKMLNLLGIKVSLVSSRIIDENLQSCIDELFPGKIYRNNNFGPYPKLIRNKFLQKIIRGLYVLLGMKFYWNKISCGWGDNFKTGDIDSAEELLGRPDLVWGICGGLLEGGVAASKISKHFDCDFIYELHDPPLKTMPEFCKDYLTYRFDDIIKSSIKVIVNSQLYLEYLQKEKSCASQSKFFCIPQCFEKKTYSPHTKISAKLTLGYFGSLNKPRSLLPILEAIRLPIENLYGSNFEFRLFLAGTGDGVTDVINYVKKYDLAESFEYVGLLSPDKLKAYEHLCDIIIVMQSPECKYEIPGKVIEAIGNGQFILGLADPDSETGKVINKYPLGVLADSNNVSSIRESFKHFVRINFSDEMAIKDLNLFVNSFLFDTQLDKLKSVIYE